MTQTELKEIALAQSAEDLGCGPSDFTCGETVVCDYRPTAERRRYYSEPFVATLVSYGGNVVAAASPEVRPAVEAYVRRYPWYHCFETPNMTALNDALSPLGCGVCFMAEYFLPELSLLTVPECPLETRVLTQPDFAGLYLPQWSNALCEKRKELDVLGVGAYDRGALVGFAACSADCEDMWQIGIDVLPEYRRQGLASALTARLTAEILARDKVPFYCAAWSNIPSVRNALRCGFRPAWVEMSVKPLASIREMNEG